MTRDRNAAGVKRAQVSLELFFALTLFALLLHWLSFFAGSTRNPELNVLGQQRLIASALAELANQACAFNTSIEMHLACFTSKGKKIDYSVTSRGDVFLVSSQLGETVEKKALCFFDNTSIQVNCSEGTGRDAGIFCMTKTSSSFVNITEGACAKS